MRLEKSPPYWSCDAMDRQETITVESILRRRTFTGIPEIPPGIFPAPHMATASLINDTIQNRFSHAPDAGVWNRLANTLLEPPNPFNSNARRRLKQDSVVLGVLILAAGGLVFYFNITAVAG
jgi:hypothetical protein